MQSKSRMNGWQRIWLVLTGLALVIGGLFYPYHLVYMNKYRDSLYRESIIKDLQSPQCSSYVSQPISSLKKPQFISGGGSCWHIYTSRNQANDDAYPYSLAAYDANEPDRKQRDFFAFAENIIVMVLIASLLLYFAGFLVAWIRRGFAKTA
jgi:hypothetical protein